MLLHQRASKRPIAAGICCLALLLSRSALSSAACTDGDGDPIASAFRFPSSFEVKAVAVRTTYNATVAEATASLAEILALDPAVSPLTFDNTIGALSLLLDEFWLPGDRIYLLSQTSDKEEVRTAATDAIVDMEKWSRDNIEFNIDLYQVIKAYEATDEAAELTGESRRLLTETIKDYERKGMALSADDRAQLTEWEDRLSEITTNISVNIRNDEGAVSFMLEELAGLNDQQLAALQYDANTTLYTVLTAIYSQYRLVTTYAIQDTTRLEAVRTRLQRSMEENAAPILEVVRTRREIARLLGFDHWADYRTADKMAGDGATAYNFIRDIDERLEGKFLEEQVDLLELKQQDLGDPAVVDLNREDVGFYTNILMENEYQINQEEISEYFAEEATLRGLFDVYEELFNIRIVFEPDGPPGGTWADGVKFIYVYEAGDEDSPIGGVYLDLHPREGKYKHFAKFGLVQGRRLTDDGGGSVYQAPLCAIVGNWPVPVGNVTTALWRFGDVKTMFHEFGHALHDVLTCAEFSAFAGTAVPRDFVEVPSQMLERWLDDMNVVRRFAKHYETGETMPDYLMQSLIDAKLATIGHSYKAQVSDGLSDLRIHTYKSAEDIPETPMGLYSATNMDYSRYYTVPNDTALLASFGHLFGGYDAGYYGYAWADAIAADLASRFRASPDGFMDSQLGALFRKEILEPGGSRDVTESIRAFLGRDWRTDAFFEEMGVANDDVESGTTPCPDDQGVDEGDQSSDEESAGAKAGMLMCFGAAIMAWLVW